MTVANAATNQWKKVMKFSVSLFSMGFNSSKCKTMTKMAVARIKLLRNKRQVVVKQMRRDIAMLLQSGQDATARIRVEHVLREQNVMAANEFIELFCELVVARLAIIAKQRECPADLKEGISSLIFAAPRCSDIPELLAIRDIFEKKYGKDFVAAATDLRPNCGVNRMLIDKLSVRTPGGEVKLKVMKEIAKEYQVEWDTTESEMELLKPPEELIQDGPNSFVSATSLPIKPMPKQSVQQSSPATTSYSDNGEKNTMHFEDTASAAEAAAESAKKAIAAAGAAAYLANRVSYQVHQASDLRQNLNGSRNNTGFDSISGNKKNFPNNYQMNSQTMSDETKVPSSINKQNSECSPVDMDTRNMYRRHSYNVPSSMKKQNSESPPVDMDAQNIYRRHSYNVPSAHSDDESDCDEEIEMEDPTSGINLSPKRIAGMDSRKINRKHSYNAQSDIKFDESDNDDDFEMEEPTRGTNLPPNRPAPGVPSTHAKRVPAHRVHPKLPDYDALAARFEALKHRKDKT